MQTTLCKVRRKQPDGNGVCNNLFQSRSLTSVAINGKELVQKCNSPCLFSRRLVQSLWVKTVHLKRHYNNKIRVFGRGDISHNMVLYLEVPFELGDSRKVIRYTHRTIDSEVFFDVRKPNKGCTYTHCLASSAYSGDSQNVTYINVSTVFPNWFVNTSTERPTV